MSVSKISVPRKSRKRFLALASELESTLMFQDATGIQSMVDTALMLREILICEDLPLRREEKVRVLKTLTRARVRAYIGGSSDGYKAFKALDGISSDVMAAL